MVLRNRRPFLLLLSCVLLLLSACGKPMGQPAKEGYVAGVVTKSSSSEYWMTLRRGMETAAEELGIELIILSPDSEARVDVQSKMVETLVKREVDAIAVSPIDSYNRPEYFDMAEEKGIPIVSYDTGFADLDVPYIGIDTRKAGEAMARQLAEALGHKGEAGIVSGGLEQQSHRQRMEGFAAYMENELGKKLFVRGNYNVRLTDEGMLLRKRAEDILDMVDKTQDEFKAMGGDVRIGCAESDGIKHLARRIKAIQKQYPAIRFHLYSGDTDDLSERLDRGLFDFAVIAQTVDLSKYNYLEFPEADTWGVIMRKDSPLAQKEKIRINDLLDLPLIVSRQGLREDIPKLFGEKADRLSVKATINLTYNGSILTREGVGYVLTFEKLVDISEQSELCFRPLTPALETKLYFIWKKYQVFTSAEELLLTEMREQMNIAAV